MMNLLLFSMNTVSAKGSDFVRNAKWNALTGVAVLLLAPVLLLTGSGCAKPEETQAGATEVPRNVRVLELAGETIDQYFEISGPVAPVRGADLSAQESGPVVAIVAAKGAAVQAGQLIVEQDRRILRAEREADVEELAETRVEERLLDLLLPIASSPKADEGSGGQDRKG